MAARFADIEFGLVWDEAQGDFDVSLRFAMGGLDQLGHPKEPLKVDLDRLRELVNNEPDYGAALTDMVFRSDALRQFYSHARAAAADVPVHFRIHVDAPARFHEVHWESLRDPDTRAPIATSRNMLLSRYLSSPNWRPIRTVPAHDPRALVVIAAPSDIGEYGGGRPLAPVVLDDELARAQAALVGYQTLVLAGSGQATLNAVLDRLNEGFDVLYIVAHGAVPEDVPVLFLERPDGTTDPVDGRRLVERIGDLDRGPTLVVLASCQSAGAGEQRRSDDGGALVALGPRLAAAGVAAVVAMQGNITMHTAGAFAQAFFAAFAREGIVDHAMAVARDAVRDRPDWWVPVLFSRLRSWRTFYEAQFTERSEETWDDLVRMINNQRFTPVLGPGLVDGILGSRREMARRWVRRWQMPIAAHGHGNLAQVAQYLRVGRQPARVSAYLHEYLQSELRERWENARGDDPFRGLPAELLDGAEPEEVIVEVGRRLRERDPGDPYRVVAALPVRVYVTTGWTDLLQRALLASRPAKEPITVCFPWTERVDWDDIGHVEQPTVQRPLVYHLFGRLEDPDSLVLTEDDYFEWLTAWIDKKQVIPPVVRRALTNSSMLFLGYQLDDWEFRVVFQSIKSFSGRTRDFYHHIGVQVRPETSVVEPEAAQRYLESYFGDDRVNIFWADTQAFLAELRSRAGIAS